MFHVEAEADRGAVRIAWKQVRSRKYRFHITKGKADLLVVESVNFLIA